MARINRKLSSPKDPVKGGSKKKTGAAVKPKAPAKKPAAPKKPAAAKKPAAPKKAPAKKAKADKDFDNARSKHLRKEKAKGKTKTIESRLKKRMESYKAGLKRLGAKQKLRRTLRKKRQTVARTNLVAKQKASWTNLLAKQKARLKARTAAKPMVKGGKVVTPKPATTKVTLVKPKLKPLPRIVGGKIVEKKRTKPVKKSPGRKQAAKKAARTKKTGKVEV